MTRLAFCFISNDVTEFHRLYKSFHYSVDDSSNTCIDSFTKNVLTNPPFPNTHVWDDWNVKHKIYNSGSKGYIDYFSMRQDSIYMADKAELIYVGDDDMIFKEGSTKYINECCQYMMENEDCGAIYLAANFGDAYKYHGDEIYIINDHHLGINKGIILRNRKEELMDNRFHALGANDDFIIGYTCVLQGYYICRRLHAPIIHDAPNNLVDIGMNSEYKFMMSKGIMSKVNKHIGEWTDHRQWPKNIFKHYRHNAQMKGFLWKYQSEE